MRSTVRAAVVLLLFGAIAILSPGPMRAAQAADVSWSVTITPNEPHPGDPIRVQATAYAQGGIPQFTIYLDEQQPAVTRLDSSPTINAQTLPATVGWDLTALQAGTQTFHISVSFETQNCPVPQPGCYFYFDFATSPAYTIDVMPSPVVGGISLDPGAGALPLQSQPSSGSGAWLLAEAIAGTAATAVVLGSAAWHVNRRRVQ